MNARKSIIICLTVIALGFYSQRSIGQGIKFGLKFDPQFSWLASKSSNIESHGSHFGFDGGLIIDYFFDENYAFATGISVNNTGGGFSSTDSFLIKVDNKDYMVKPGQQLEIRQQYIHVPIGLKFKTREFGSTTVFAQVGFNPQICISAKVKASDNVPEGNFYDEASFFDMGYHFGAGVLYSLGGNTALTAGILFKNGFVDVSSSDQYSYNLNTLSIRIGVMF